MQLQLVMGTGAGSTVGFQESPAPLSPGESQHHRKELLVLESLLKYKHREHEAGCADLTFMASFSTDELGWGCGKLFCSSKTGRVSGVGGLAWVPSHLLPAWK